jgi:hypothetical protein
MTTSITAQRHNSESSSDDSSDGHFSTQSSNNDEYEETFSDLEQVEVDGENEDGGYDIGKLI